MNESNALIKRESDGRITLGADAALQIEQFERQIKEIKEKEDALRALILKAMQEENILTLETERLKITYVEPYPRESLDTKALKEELPDIYDEYCRITTTKPSIRIKVTP